MCFEDGDNLFHILKSLKIPGLRITHVVTSRSDLVTIEERKELLKAVIYGYGRSYTLTALRNPKVNKAFFWGPDLREDVKILSIKVIRSRFSFCYIPDIGVTPSVYSQRILIGYLLGIIEKALETSINKKHSFSLRVSRGNDDEEPVEGEESRIIDTLHFAIENLVDVTTSIHLVVILENDKTFTVDIGFLSGDFNRVEVEEFQTVEEYRDLISQIGHGQGVNRFDIHSVNEWKNYAYALKNKLLYNCMLNENLTCTAFAFALNEKSIPIPIDGLLPNVGSKILGVYIFDEKVKVDEKTFIFNKLGQFEAIRHLRKVITDYLYKDPNFMRRIGYVEDMSYIDLDGVERFIKLPVLKVEEAAEEDEIDRLLIPYGVQTLSFRVVHGISRNIMVRLTTYIYTHDDPEK